jgi:hypothetical protein
MYNMVVMVFLFVCNYELFPSLKLLTLSRKAPNVSMSTSRYKLKRRKVGIDMGSRIASKKP